MKQAALCFPLSADGRVLLGRKKQGFGAGKVAGLGGKLEPGEDSRAAAVRELYEEAGLRLDPADLRDAGHIDFLFPTHPAWDHAVDLFITHRWQGEPAASDEITPEWHALDALPFGRMWDDGRYWLGRVLSGGRLRARFVYAADLATVAEAYVEELE